MADFSVNCVAIVKGALRACGALATGQSLDSGEQDDAVQALNMVVKQLQGPPSYLLKGMQPWRRERGSITLGAKALYELKSSGGDLDISVPIKILSARIKDEDNNETPLASLTLDEYEAITNKSETNPPAGFYYERKLSVGNLRLNCIPEDIVNDTLEITYLDQIAAFETVRTTTDFPAEYYRVLKFALAVDIAPEYGVQNIGGLKVLRDEAIATANTFHTDETFYYFQPEVD